MATDHRAKLASIRRFDQLVTYLRDEMGWPISKDSFDDVDDLFYEFTPEELGIDVNNAAKIQEIRRLRPLSAQQPWGIFFVKFEPRNLPVVALRRILSQVALKKRASANSAERTAWSTDDLLFVSNYGEGEYRQISFAHFSQNVAKTNLPTLKVLGWDKRDTPLHLDYVADLLTERLSWPDDESDVEEWRKQWRSAFTLTHREVINTSRKLSIELAKLARSIRDRIKTVLEIETENGPVYKLMTAFKEALIEDIDPDSFADMYAQTISYGLLSAHVTNPSSGATDDVVLAMPTTNPFLKELMETFLDVGGRRIDTDGTVGLDFDELGINDVVELLNAPETQMDAVLRDFGDRNPLEDPVIHFYEQFFAEYDNAERFKRGVFYTPRPVVTYIVHSVDELLRSKFGLKDGLADTTSWREMSERFKNVEIPQEIDPDQPFVQILDPATGTGTFLVEVVSLVHDTMVTNWRGEGYNSHRIRQLWNEYVPRYLLPRIYGYELMMAPYAIAHMKIGLKLLETGYDFKSEERTRVFLTNALEPTQEFSDRFAFAIPALAHEAEAVNKIKSEQRFTVVIGNPPYSRTTSNTGEFIEELMNDYKDPVRTERNIQPLSDDYIKFLRFSHHSLNKVPASVMGMITNGTYISGRIHRGMRELIGHDFSLKFITNLHGSARIASAPQQGCIDENVFDIQQGVTISIWCNQLSDEEGVFYRDITGNREQKYNRLQEDIEFDGDWIQLNPTTPYYLWIQRDNSYTDEYSRYTPLEQVFRYHSVSGKPGDDNLLVSFEKSEVVPKLKEFKCNVNPETERLTEAGRKLASWDDSQGYDNLAVSQYAYRPFDVRWTYYDPDIWTRALTRLHSHVSGAPILLTTKLIKDNSFAHVFVTRVFPDVIFLSNKSSVNCYSFPMGVPNEGDLADQAVTDSTSNMDISVVSSDNGYHWDDTKAFNWIYSILHSSEYRTRYFEMLQYDFPRIPFGGESAMVEQIVDLGTYLVSLHLLEAAELENERIDVLSHGLLTVERVSYSDDTVWVDRAKSVGFKGVTEPVWNFSIGGYKVCEKWLKDRQAKGGKNPRPSRILSDEDIIHYKKMVVAIDETIRVMSEIDEVIESYGGWPWAFES